MATVSTWGNYPLPVASEAADVPLDLMQVVEAMDPHTVQFATSVSDRNTKFNGIDAGAVVVCASLKTAWLSLGSSVWQRIVVDSGWVTTGFTYPNADWSAGSYARVRNVNGVTELRAGVLHAGASVASDPVTGNLVNVALINLPAGYRPLTWPTFSVGYWPGMGAAVNLQIDTTGDVIILDTQPNISLVSSASLQISATWLDG